MTRVAALALFSARANLRMWTTRLGLLFGFGIAALGPLVSLRAGRGWTLDPDLAFYGVLVALLFGLRSGLEQQREAGLAEFLRHDLVPPVPYAAAMLGSVLLAWLVLFLGVFVALWVLSLGDTGTAAWYAAAWSLRSALLVGSVPLIERFLAVRLPFVLPVAVYFLALIQLTLVLGEAEATRLFAASDRADPSTLLDLARQVLLALPLSGLLFLGVAAVEQHAGATRRAIVPTGHGGAPHHG